jgi:hypothetical protein
MSHAVILVAVECDESEILDAVSEQMRPFDEKVGWFEDGTRWDWYVIGGRWDGYLAGKNYMRRSEIDLSEIAAYRTKELKETYSKAMADFPEHREFIYGVKPDDTEESYIKERIIGGFPTFAAFLQEHVWHERARMGWFGCDTATECEIAGKKDVKRCFYRGEEFRIVSHQNDPKWPEKFYPRFVDPLDPETWLVVVDYHV